MDLPASVAAAPSVILCTLNASYIHAALGLRYLLANMGELRGQTTLREFTLARRSGAMAQELLETLGPPDRQRVQIVAFGVYIWNVTQTCALVARLRQLRPGLRIVLGGPEVSHELDGQAIVALADHVITGWGDVSFPKLCRALLLGPRPLMKIIVGEQPALDAIKLPYGEYSAADIAHRVLYVEAARGCPFKCEFCLSSLDKTAWAFDPDRFLDALDALYRRGARGFKFVDRTFNLKIDASLRILQFFLDRLPSAADPALFVHFELIPDHLPQPLKDAIARFPAGVLQFEVGVQSFNVEVQQRISRRQDNARTLANLRWLVQSSQAHVHADLIFGLPGEDMASFARGFDRLLALRPHEIQLGLLKRLRGTPIERHRTQFGMVFEAAPPYTVRQTGVISASDVQRFTRLARYWDLIANSGRFQRTLRLLLGTSASDVGAASSPGDEASAAPAQGSAFDAMLGFSDWLWQVTGLTSGLTPELLVDHLFDYLVQCRQCDAPACRDALLADYLDSGARASPNALRQLLAGRRSAVHKRSRDVPARQRQHLRASAVVGRVD